MEKKGKWGYPEGHNTSRNGRMRKRYRTLEGDERPQLAWIQRRNIYSIVVFCEFNPP